MTAADVESVLSELGAAGIACWITGGWGIDALIGRQTREHDDLDISIAAPDLEQTMSVFTRLGYEVATDWLPVRVAVRDGVGREVDVHPIVFEADGSAWLPDLDGGRFHYPAGSFVHGKVGAKTVPCISADLQAMFHLGYEAGPKDRADMRALVEAGLIAAEQAGIAEP